MSYALVQNGTTVIPPIFDGAIPNPLPLPNGDQVLGVTVSWTSQDGVYSIIPAQYDTPPANGVENGPCSYLVSKGIAQITRTWVLSPQSLQHPQFVQINSVSTPSLNGAYPISLPYLSSYNMLANYVQAFNTFPNGSASMSINDVNGIPHNFTITAFLAFYHAVTYYSSAPQAIQTPLTIA